MKIEKAKIKSKEGTAILFASGQRIEKIEDKDFWVRCNVCGAILKNHVGSTACCGSIAYQLTDEEIKERGLE